MYLQIVNTRDGLKFSRYFFFENSRVFSFSDFCVINKKYDTFKFLGQSSRRLIQIFEIFSFFFSKIQNVDPNIVLYLKRLY